ncbi:unnamed protein product [Leuciscus chuanchicus]
MLINVCTVVLIMIHGVEGLSLDQNQKVLVKLKGKTVSFRCEVTGLGTSNYVHWYLKKDGETFKRLLYISASGTATIEAKDFVSEKIGNSYGIKLKETKEEHAGMYYCACWDGSHNCLNGQNIPIHPDPVLIKVNGRVARITCNVDSSTLQSNVLHWYRAQPGGAFQRFMYFEAGSLTAKIDPAVVGSRFSGTVKNQQVSLTISKVQFDDTGSYYCALYDGDNTVLTK